MGKFGIEKIKNFVEIESNSGCELISQSYINLSKEKLDFKCKCGRSFSMYFCVFKKGRMGCPLCAGHEGNAYVFTDEDIKDILDMYNSGDCVDIIRKKYKTRIENISNILKENDVHIKRTYEYKTSKELATNRKYYLDEDTFENIDSHDKAYWLGFLFADGYVSNKKGKDGGTKGINIELCLKEEDYYHVHNFATFIKSNYPVKKKVVKLNDKEFIAYRVCIASVKMGNDLISHGCTPNKSLTLKYPENFDEKYFPSFLLGYWDGDGCLSFNLHEDGKYNNLVSMMGTFEFLSIIKEKLEINGIKTRRIYKSISKAYTLEISNYSHSDFFNLVYHKSSYMLGRKFDKFLDMLEFRKKEFNLSPVANLFRLIY